MSTLVSVVPRHPETLRDASGKLVGKGPIEVDQRDPFWRRLIRWGDVDIQTTKPVATVAASAAVTTTASQSGSKA